MLICWYWDEGEGQTLDVITYSLHPKLYDVLSISRILKNVINIV